MPKLIAIWSQPNDTDGFESDYTSTHLPLAEGLPGAKVEAGRVVDGDGYRYAILTFDSMEALQSAMGSEAGASTMQDATRLQEQYGNSLQVFVGD